MAEIEHHNKNELSKAAREKLRKNAESRQNGSKYLKLEPSEKKDAKVQSRSYRPNSS
jgi:hypothetical protein